MEQNALDWIGLNWMAQQRMTVKMVNGRGVHDNDDVHQYQTLCDDNNDDDTVMDICGYGAVEQQNANNYS